MVIVKDNPWLGFICTPLCPVRNLVQHISSKLATLNLVSKEHRLVGLDCLIHIHPLDGALDDTKSEQCAPCLIDMHDLMDIVCLSDVDNTM